MTLFPTLADIRLAHARIAPHVHRTPILKSRVIDERLGAQLLFKAENFQRTGSFKARGAFNAILSLDEQQRTKGVVTHSSGNHAAALAMAAGAMGTACTVVMPSTAPIVKKDAVAAYGALIVECEPTLAAREAAVAHLQSQTGATYIPPFDHREVAAGQGTAAIELLEDTEVPLDLICCPVGGGGLLAGTITAVKAIAPHISVWAAEPALADDAARGFQQGHIHPQILPVKTIADGLTTSMSAMTFDVMKNGAAGVGVASEKAIIEAMRLLWSRLKIVVEPSSAVPLAAMLEGTIDVKGKTVGVILTGGNVDLDRLPWSLA